MCGVAGLFAYHRAADPIDRAELRQLCEVMRSRGPDGSGEWYSADGRLGLGHQRLAILDLSQRGAQPMLSEDRQLAVSFNGEIYNYPELRRGLEATGVRFRSDCDTEILLHLYRRDGLEMFAKLRGMFALALWDVTAQRLLLARDPYGIKPLYYSNDGWTLRLASQVRALAALPRVSRELDPAGCVGFFLLGSVPEPWTCYRRIQLVPAGSYVLVDQTGPHPPVIFQNVAALLGSNAVEKCSEREMAERVRDAVRESIKAHLQSDVPVGCFLSAGVDSAAVTGAAAEFLSYPVNAITLEFPEFRGKPEDEAPGAQRSAQAFGVRHSRVEITRSEFSRDCEQIFRAMDQPSIDGVNTWLVSRAAASHGLKVALSGVGGDELFYGYSSFVDVPRMHALAAWSRRLPGVGRMLRRLSAPLLRHLPVTPKIAGLLEYGATLPGAYLLKRGLWMPWELDQILPHDFVRDGLARLSPVEHIGRLLPRPNQFGPAATVAALEATHYMRNQLLRDTDWASMAHSLEVRVPLVDVDLLRKLGPSIEHYREGAGKRWLAGVPAKPVPEEVRNRPKTGFATPVSLWLQDHALLQSWREVPALRSSYILWARRFAYAAFRQVVGSVA